MVDRTDSAPTSASVQRALRRAATGRALDVDEASRAAGRPGRRAGRAAPGRRRRSATPGCGRPAGPGVVTYSKKVFIPLTRLCRDRCHYCTFATVPHRLPAAVPRPGRGAGDRPRGRRAGLQGGAVHPRRPAGGALAGGPAVAGRARLRLHPGLPAGLRGGGAGGDRPAAAPQPGRAVLVGAAAAQAGRAEHGDDAGDHARPGSGRSRAARTSARRTRSRRSGCGCSTTPAGSGCRSPPAS